MNGRGYLFQRIVNGRGSGGPASHFRTFPDLVHPRACIKNLQIIVYASGFIIIMMVLFLLYFTVPAKHIIMSHPELAQIPVPD